MNKFWFENGLSFSFAYFLTPLSGPLYFGTIKGQRE